MGRYYPELKQATASTSAATAANATVVAADPGRQICVAHVYVMSDTAGTITLEDGADGTELLEFYPAANGGAELTAPVGEYLCKTTAGNALVWDVDTTSTSFISVLYTTI